MTDRTAPAAGLLTPPARLEPDANVLITACVVLVMLAIAGLIFVLRHHPGTVPISKGWFKFGGITGRGGVVGGFLFAVFAFTGWDATV